MKKRLISSLMVGALSLSVLAGCTGKAGSSNSDLVTELKNPTTIEIWHYMNGKQAETLQSIVDDFNATNDKQITVNAVSQGSITDLNKKVITAAQSNSLPAIVNVYPDVATGLIEQKKVVDLANFINNEEVGMKEDFENDFVNSFIEEVSQWEKGKIYGLPMTKSTEVVYVNKNLLEEIGYKVEDLNNLTMTKLVEISKAAKEKLNIPGFGFDSASNAFISTLKMDGKDFIELNGTINLDNEWVREYMEFYKKNTEEGNFRIAGEDKYLSDAFSNQKLLMYQGSTAGAAHIKTNDAFEVAVIEAPVFEGKDKAVIQQGASLFATTDVSAEEQYAAYEFLKFLTSTENTAKFAVSTGYLPVRKSAVETTTVKDALADENGMYGKVYTQAQKALEYSYYTPAVNNAQSARDVIQEKYEAYVTGTISDIETFIKDSLSQVETSIQRQ